MSETGRSLTPHVFKRLIALARKEGGLKQKMHLLTGVLNCSQLVDEEIDRVWSDYLRTLSRFELIKTLSSNNRNLTWIEDLRQKKLSVVILV